MKMDELVAPRSVGGLDFRLPCAICGRKFAVESLEKHQNICEKTSSKKRKTFNSAKQRLLGSEGSSWTNSQLPTPSAPPAPPPRKITPINKKSSQGRKYDRSLIEPLKLSQGIPVPSPVTRGRLNGGGDYIQCPTCDRNFSEKAADRHIQWCREQKIRIPRSPPCNIAKDRLNARIQYKAPLPGKRRASPPRVPTLNKSLSPYSQSSLNNLYLPSIQFNQVPGVKVTGKAITAQRKIGDLKKPVGKANSHAGSSNHLTPSDSWEWVTSATRPFAEKQLQKKNFNSVNKPTRTNNNEERQDYDPFVSAQKQLEDLVLSTCGSPVVEQIPSSNKNIKDTEMNRLNQSSNWSLSSDKDNRNVDDLVEDLIIGIEPHLEDEYSFQLMNANDGSGRPSRNVRRTVSREEALFGTKNSSGSQDSDYGSLLMRRSPSSPTRLSPSQRFGVNHNYEQNNLCTSTSSSESSLPPLGKADSKCSRFCHECGCKYPVFDAKFCCECGVKRFYAT